MNTITENTPIRRKPNLLEAEVDGEIIALDVDRGECYGLNTVASAVWEHLSKQTSVADICTQLTEEFSVSPEVCREEVLGLVRRFHEDGLLITGA